MKAEKRKIFIFTGVFIIISVLSVGKIYFDQLQKATESMMRATMEELAAHDAENIESQVDSYWNELDSIYMRMENSKIDEIQDLCTHLDIEQRSGIYTRVFMLDSEGNMYSGMNRAVNRADKIHVQKLLDGEEKIALNYAYRADGQWNLKKEVLVIGERKEAFTIEGATFIGIIGFIDVDKLENRLKLDCFDGAGKTTVIDFNGDYIVNMNHGENAEGRGNYFSELEKKCKQPKEHIKRLQERIHTEHDFFDKVECGMAEEVAYYHVLDNVNWIMLMTVPESIVAQSTDRFVRMSIAMLLMLVVIVIVAASVCMRFFMNAVKERANSKARSEFLSIMSHEIRTPLNGLIGLNYLMQNNLDDTEKLQEYLRKSSSTGQYLMTLINDILDMSKLQAGKMEICEQPFSVQYMISTVESIMRSRMEDKKIHFEIKKEILQDSLIGDEMRIEQILMNILGNAVKFVEAGSGHVIFSIRQTELEQSQVRTIYEVTDNGCGITEEFQEHIFDSFAQDASVRENGLRGTGLGMPISLLLAEQMGGTLTVKSEVGEGSTFTLTVVSKISDTAPDTIIQTESIEDDILQNEALHILLAEDQDLNAEILTELLEEAGFSVTRAENGVEVVELFEASPIHTYDLILMDVQMPERNGYEATKIIRALNREDADTVIIYACTANAFREDRDRALDSGMDDFIPKPINVEKLLNKLRTRNAANKRREENAYDSEGML